MKKLIFTIAMFTCINANAQWVVKRLDNGFDAPTKIAFTEDGQKPYMKLERYDELVALYLGGIYICEGPVFVELSFQVNGVNKQYGRVGNMNEENTIVFVSFDMIAEDFLIDFKNATSVKIRITDPGCESKDIFNFKMTGSTAALNFVSKP
jgi:hypothetical protein